MVDTLVVLTFGALLVSVVDQAFQPTQVSIWLALTDRGAVSGRIVS